MAIFSQSNKLFVPFLLAGMLITGCANSIFSKYQDNVCVEDCDGKRPVLFEQPVWQTLQMFIGEMLCFLIVLYNSIQARYAKSKSGVVRLPAEDDGSAPLDDNVEALKASEGDELEDMRGWSILLMWIPAVCDLSGTTLMNIGLLYTPVSIYQMTRGALVLWVGVFSVIFLHRKLWLYQWLSLVTVMIGVSLVGLSGTLASDTGSGQTDGLVTFFARSLMKEDEGGLPDDVKVLIGILFILFAQLFTASQFVVEEKILSVYSVHPLLAVGYEGVFGAVTILLVFPILIHYKESSPFFDLKRGWTQMVSNPPVLASSFIIMVSIGLFNAFGLSVTRYLSATARSTADTCRTIGIWVVSLILGWERLTWPWTVMQLAGFAVLVYGTFVFNDLTAPPSFLKKPETPVSPEEGADGEERQGLLSSEHALEETATLPANLGSSGFDVVPPPNNRG